MAKAQIITKNVDINALRASKDAELSFACGASITNPYQSKIVLQSTNTAHMYGTDQYDQLNMQQKLIMMLSDRSMINVSFKTKDSGFVDHTREEFIAIVKEVGDMIEKARMKLGGFRIQLASANTETQIMNIIWS